MTDDRRRRRGGVLGWPAVWAAPTSTRNMVSLGFFVLVAAVPSFGGVAALVNQDSRAVRMLFGVVLMVPCLLFLLLTRIGLRRRAPSAVSCDGVRGITERAVRIPYSLPVATTYWVLGLLALLFFSFITVASALSFLHGRIALDTIFPLILGLGVSIYLLWFVFDGLRGKLARGVVALTPAGVYHRSWAFRSYAPWDSVMDVQAAEADGPLIELLVSANGASWYERTSILWNQEELSLTPHMAIRGRWLSVDPALLYHALRYYHTHPEARPELGTPAGARRISEACVNLGPRTISENISQSRQGSFPVRTTMSRTVPIPAHRTAACTAR